MHSIVAYSVRRNIYSRYCNHSLTHNRGIGVNRSINIVTTRSVNRPNARLAVHAFRINKTTDSTSISGDVSMHGTNRTRFRGVGAIRRASNRLIVMSHSTRVTLASRLNHRHRHCGIPCNSDILIGRRSRIRNNRAVTG